MSRPANRAQPTISDVVPADLPAIAILIETAVRTSVAANEDDADLLVAHIATNLEWWRTHEHCSCHLKYVQGERIVGAILVKNYWNLCNLFVAPDCYRQGIGRQLVWAAANRSRAEPGVSVLKVNSSSYATGFYEALGFVQTGPAIDRPGGCVPYEMRLDMAAPS